MEGAVLYYSDSRILYLRFFPFPFFPLTVILSPDTTTARQSQGSFFLPSFPPLHRYSPSHAHVPLSSLPRKSPDMLPSSWSTEYLTNTDTRRDLGLRRSRPRALFPASRQWSNAGRRHERALRRRATDREAG